MYGKRSAPVLVVLGAMLLTGCGLPPGVDGDLVGDWPAMAEPEPIVPEAGVCVRASHRSVISLRTYEPLPCTADHLVEIAYVGVFEDEIAARRTPPEPGTGQWRTTYRQCEDAVAEYLGADFRSGWLSMGVAVPTEEAWQGGARWFRCDLMETTNPLGMSIRRESRRGLLAEDSESDLRLRCVYYPEGEFAVYRRVDCDREHHAQFVGVLPWVGNKRPNLQDESTLGRIYQGCRELIAAYAEVPVDRFLAYRSGVHFWPPLPYDWRDGDRSMRCFLWSEEAITGSFAGAGDRGLPIDFG